MHWNIIKDIFKTMGNGLSMQYLGEMRPHETKLIEMNQASSSSVNSKRIVYATNENIQQNALNFSIEFAQREGALLEVLYSSESKHCKEVMHSIVSSLFSANIDFQVTRRSGGLLNVILEHTHIQKDILCLVCGESDSLRQQWQKYQNTSACKKQPTLPYVHMVADGMVA